MSLANRVIRLAAMMVAAFGLSGPLYGQEGAPADAKAAPAEGDAAPKDDKPAPAAKKSVAGRSSEPAEVVMPALPDPAVEAVLDSKPSTPAELLNAAKLLAGLGRADLSKKFLAQLLAAKLDDAQASALVNQAGSDVLLALAGRDDLQPESQQLATSLLEGAGRHARDPKQIQQWIEALGSKSAEERGKAAAGLLRAETTTLAPLLAVLADPQRAGQHTYAGEVIAMMGQSAVGPLLCIVQSPETAWAVQAAGLLASSKNQQAAIELLVPAMSEATPAALRQAAAGSVQKLMGRLPRREEAVGLLMTRAREYMTGRRQPSGVVDGQATIWQWDEAGKQPVAQKLSTADAARMLAARFAAGARAVAPSDKAAQRLHLIAGLEAACYANGLDKTLPDDSGLAAEAAKCDVATLQDALYEAMQGRQFAAATVMVEILGRIGTAEHVLYRAEKPTALVYALRQPEARLRMAAAEAIMRLAPARPFAGSSYLPEALKFFASTTGSRRILIGGPCDDETLRLFTPLVTAGFRIDKAATGRDVLRLATQCPDYEFAWIDVAIDNPPADLLVQQLRHDWHSGALRVGLWERAEESMEGLKFAGQGTKIAEANPLTLAFTRPHDPAAADWQLKQLLAVEPQTLVPYAMRQAYAVMSLQLLNRLATSSGAVFEVPRLEEIGLAALSNPVLSPQAVGLAETMGTPANQRALADLASQRGAPEELRKAACEAFRRSVAEHGILLTSSEILLQYERYNASEHLDRGTQQILSKILDILEAHGAKAQPAAKTSPADQPQSAGGK